MSARQIEREERGARASSPQFAASCREHPTTLLADKDVNPPIHAVRASGKMPEEAGWKPALPIFHREGTLYFL